MQKGRKLHVWNVDITDSAGDIISTVHVTNYIVSPKKEKDNNQDNQQDKGKSQDNEQEQIKEKEEK